MISEAVPVNVDFQHYPFLVHKEVKHCKRSCQTSLSPRWLVLLTIPMRFYSQRTQNIKQRRFKILLTSWRWINVELTLFQCCVPAGLLQIFFFFFFFFFFYVGYCNCALGSCHCLLLISSFSVPRAFLRHVKSFQKDWCRISLSMGRITRALHLLTWTVHL